MNDNKVHTYTYMSDMWNTRLNLVRYRIELVRKFETISYITITLIIIILEKAL